MLLQKKKVLQKKIITKQNKKNLSFFKNFFK